jgi:hypothetical protein
MKDRELEALRNETLRELSKIEELRRKQELSELRTNEAMKIIHENIEKLDAKDQEI